MQNFILVKTERDNDQIRRVLREDALERLFRGYDIEDDHYRVARLLQEDISNAGKLGGGGALVRCGDAFVPAPVGGPRKTNDRALEARQRVRRAQEAVGADLMFAILLEFLEQNFSLRELDKRWKQRKGTARGSIGEALDRIWREDVYGDRLHRVQIWAAA